MSHALCPRCGTPTVESVLSGQCPNCLGRLAFGGDEASVPGFEPGGGDLEFLREIGRGGMGIVYEARQTRLNRLVAVKTLPGAGVARPDFVRRFRAEAEAAALLRHPNIVTVHEYGERDGQPFLVMELVRGPSLADLVRSRPLPAGRAARYVRLAALAVAHAHDAGVLHRDLKPSNILVDEFDQPRLTDFGLAKLLDASADLTRTGELLGSPGYLPPEQVAGRPIGVTGDVYALGAVLYELITSRPPFAADTVAATLQQVVRGDPVSPRWLNPAIPTDLETVCLKCLRRDPAHRYPSARTLAEDLDRFERGEPILARPISLAERCAAACRRRPTVAAAVTATVVALAAGFAGVWSQWRHTESARADLARNLYAADVAAAAHSVLEGNLGRARELLLRQAPKNGEDGEFTWRFLWARCQGHEQAVLANHDWIVTCLAVSPDGKYLASGSQSASGSGSPTLRLRHRPFAPGSPGTDVPLPMTDTVWSVAFSADGRTLVSAGDGGLRFWDVTSATRRSDLPSVPGHELALVGTTLVASPNHPFFDAGSPAPMLRLDLATRAVDTLPVRGRHPALSPDGRLLAVLDAERSIRLYDFPSGAPLHTLATNHLSFRLRFAPSGLHLAAAGQMTSAKVWSLDPPGSPPELFPSPHNVWDVAFSPDMRRLATATSHQHLELWDFPETRPLGSLAGHDNEIWTVVASPDGRHLVSGGKDGTVRLWPFAPPSATPTIPHARQARPVFSPNGLRLLATPPSSNAGPVTVWSMPPQGSDARSRPIASGSVPGPVLGFAPDPDSVLVLRENPLALDWVRIGPPHTRRTVVAAGASAPTVPSSVVLSGDSLSFCAVDSNGVLHRWSTEDGTTLNTIEAPEIAKSVREALASRPGPGRALRCIAASTSGRWLAAGTYREAAAFLVDFASGVVRTLPGHRDDIAAVAFSADEKRLATGSVDGTVRLWSVVDGTLIGELPGHLESVEAVAFSPDGRTLVSVRPGIAVTFWDWATGRELARIPHPEAGSHLAFSPDGRRLAIGVTQGNLETTTDRLELWDAP